MFYVLANPHSFTHNFVANDERVWGRKPTTTQAMESFLVKGESRAPPVDLHVQVRSADAAAFDLDVDIVVLKWLWVKFLPAHVALSAASQQTANAVLTREILTNSGWVMGYPTKEVVVLFSHCDLCARTRTAASRKN